MANHRLDEGGELDRVLNALTDRSRRKISSARLERAGLLRRWVIGRHHTCQLQPRALVVAQRWLGHTAASDMRRRRA